MDGSALAIVEEAPEAAPEYAPTPALEYLDSWLMNLQGSKSLKQDLEAGIARLHSLLEKERDQIAEKDLRTSELNNQLLSKDEAHQSAIKTLESDLRAEHDVAIKEERAAMRGSIVEGIRMIMDATPDLRLREALIHALERLGDRTISFADLNSSLEVYMTLQR